MKHPLVLSAIALCATALQAGADDAVTVHGSIQADVLFPETDEAINTGESEKALLTNTYATLGVYSKYIDGGLRFEYLERPLPGFEPDFKGWGLPNIYVRGRYKGMDLTVGDYYEQFGSGMILRTYEDRSLGVDNSLRGARLKVNSVKGTRITALGGVQRVYWDWNTRSAVYGADIEWDANEYIKPLADHNITWTLGASYVLKHQDDEDIVVAGSNNRLNLPHNVSAFDLRTQFYKSGLDLKLEYAWKGQDPSFDNNYTYAYGTALLGSIAYSKSGMSVFVQGKRSDNMSYRSRRSQTLAAAFINNLPPFAYQHTYALAAMYPYATQAAPGEWAFQGALAYNFKRGTALGGKYGTKLKLNASYIAGIERDPVTEDKSHLAGTDWWKPGGGGIGDIYYTDINLQMDKKLTKDFNLNLMYMFQKYNQTVIEGHGGMINSNIFVAEGKYKINKELTLRGELQYLQTNDDQKDWCYGLLELSVLPELMFTLSDQWNCGDTGLHYYMASVTASGKNHRLMLSYGRTRAGYNCAGGVCRYVPATRGPQIAYTYNF